MTRREFNIISRIMCLQVQLIEDDIGLENEAKETVKRFADGLRDDMNTLFVEDTISTTSINFPNNSSWSGEVTLL